MTVEVAALTGGVGGAKLVLGLARTVPGRGLACIVNVADDFDHLGLRICPDVDTVLYTLGGVADPDRGWGLAAESWRFMAQLAALGGPAWFQLGDGDLALHVVRSDALARGSTLTAVTAQVAAKLGVDALVLPVTDDRVSSLVHTPEGTLPFQEYFVARRAEPVLKGVKYAGSERARLTREVSAVLESPTLRAIVICPSNPWLSIDPLLAIPELRERMRNSGVPVIGVSPIVGGRAIKGPTAKIMREQGLPLDPLAVLEHYEGLCDGWVIDREDASLAARCHVPVLVTETVMHSLASKEQLARDVLVFAERLASARRSPSAT
jgi:LPPG:FO 2-phospho-L-lactate transferase